MRGEDLVRLSAVLGGEDQGTAGIKARQHPETEMSETMTKLKNLGDLNQRQHRRWHEANSNEPRPNGIACPDCGHELNDTAPNIVMTSNPPQKNIGCPGCDYVGFRIA